jgi:hypothetical protein
MNDAKRDLSTKYVKTGLVFLNIFRLWKGTNKNFNFTNQTK